ncbi:MAG TPA: glutamate synthase [Thermoanaerobaculia bacterium]
MAHLTPYPLAGLFARAFAELEQNGSIFDLPSHRFSPGERDVDTRVTIHGRTAGAPLGPSAGPHTQLAQGIVLSWLGGGRFIELKTVQCNDTLRIPRPCIDVRGIGLNVEWSQELRIEQSLEEYVKAAMLIEILARHFGVAPGCLFDMSVGYDLDGVRSDRMVAFMRGLADARGTIDRLRRELPPPWRDFDFETAVSGSVTLSTFHGCPVSEIERIADFLMSEMGLDCAIKLNPTLLGRAPLLDILHDRLGYSTIQVPPGAFDNDPDWDEAAEIVGRLRIRARALGRSFAVKLTNTLVVENHSEFLPASEKLAYLSGPPLHVLAMHLVRRFRHTFGDSLPISFSAGIDRRNYPDAVALGLAPVTVCTDLLKPGGYTRLHAYGAELVRRMEAAGARTVAEFAHAGIDAYVESLDHDRRYRQEQVEHATHNTGLPLGLFDCSTCDLCISACPTDANMRLRSVDCAILFTRKHQIANFADFCNDCGNCEIVCPDLGAPQRTKMRFFGSEESWRSHAPLDGFWIGAGITRARINGVEHDDGSAHPLVQYARRAALDRSYINYINALG